VDALLVEGDLDDAEDAKAVPVAVAVAMDARRAVGDADAVGLLVAFEGEKEEKELPEAEAEARLAGGGTCRAVAADDDGEVVIVVVVNDARRGEGVDEEARLLAADGLGETAEEEAEAEEAEARLLARTGGDIEAEDRRCCTGGESTAAPFRPFCILSGEPLPLPLLLLIEDLLLT
jgi:hypothetical protein